MAGGGGGRGPRGRRVCHRPGDPETGGTSPRGGWRRSASIWLICFPPFGVKGITIGHIVFSRGLEQMEVWGGSHLIVSRERRE